MPRPNDKTARERNKTSLTTSLFQTFSTRKITKPRKIMKVPKIGEMKRNDETRIPEMKPKIKMKTLFVFVFCSIIENGIKIIGKGGGDLIRAFIQRHARVSSHIFPFNIFPFYHTKKFLP